MRKDIEKAIKDTLVIKNKTMEAPRTYFWKYFIQTKEGKKRYKEMVLNEDTHEIQEWKNYRNR